MLRVEDPKLPLNDTLTFLTPENIGKFLAFFIVGYLVWKIWVSMPKFIAAILVIVILAVIGAITINLR